MLKDLVVLKSTCMNIATSREREFLSSKSSCGCCSSNRHTGPWDSGRNSQISRDHVGSATRKRGPYANEGDAVNIKHEGEGRLWCYARSIIESRLPPGETPEDDLWISSFCQGPSQVVHVGLGIVCLYYLRLQHHYKREGADFSDASRNARPLPIQNDADHNIVSPVSLSLLCQGLRWYGVQIMLSYMYQRRGQYSSIIYTPPVRKTGRPRSVINFLLHLASFLFRGVPPVSQPPGPFTP
jgi:hypothetical protein